MSRFTVRLPIRLWLAMALVVVVVVPTLTTWWLGTALSAWQLQAKQARLDSALHLVSKDVTRWSDPAWRLQVRPQLAALHVVVQLVDGTGRLVEDTLMPAGAAGFLTSVSAPPRTQSFSGSPAPAVLTGGTSCSGSVTAQVRTDGQEYAPVPKDTIPGLASGTAVCPGTKGAEIISLNGSSSGVGMLGEGVVREVIQARSLGGRALETQGTVYLLPVPDAGASSVVQFGGVTAQFLSVAGLTWVVPLGGLTALLVTLAVLSWFLQRTILRPLAAMRRAARQIAGGDLEVRVPPSPAREVAEVAEALEAMGAVLSTALERQEELEEQRRLFIGAIAHDLRTPLFTLRAHLGGLRDGLASAPDKAASYVEVCCEKADALERLIGDLFTYTRVEYLEEAPRTESLDLGALLQQMVAGLQPQAAAKGVTLEVSGGEQPALLTGDRQLLTRVVENLLDNALRHTPPGGRVGVHWRWEAAAVVFWVEDSGPGIAAHDLPHLFTPLYRGEASRNRQTGGAGLGLAIARRIMQAHGGALTAANRPAGGAVFSGMLPADRRVRALPVPVAATR